MERPLRAPSPVVLGRGGLLLTNDHLLKGADLVPGWLTGKLSDFAGLIVAPIVVSALVAARTDRRRALAFVAVGGWFAAANLFAPVAAATTALGHGLGLSWTFWVDPTDLVALAILPVAWQVARHRPRWATPARWGERLAFGFGLAACIASPTPEPTWTTDAFLVNRTGREVEVRVRWVEATVDCAQVEHRFAEVLSRDAFEAGTRFVLAPNSTLPLDRGIARPADDAIPGEIREPDPIDHAGTCDLAILSADGLAEVMIYWDELGSHTIPTMVDDENDEMRVESGIDLVADEADPTRLRLDMAPGYHDAVPIDVVDSTSCREYGTTAGFGWSAFPMWSGETVRLAEVSATIDDCVSVLIEDEGDHEWRGFICVPPTDFPFLPNSEVDIWNSGSELRIARDLALEDGTLWRTGELRIVRGVQRLVDGPFDVSLHSLEDDCAGVRMECGGFRIPAAVGYMDRGSLRYVHPSEIVERDHTDGRRVRLRVGRSEAMIATHPACGAGRDVLGPRLEALVVYGEEPR